MSELLGLGGLFVSSFVSATVLPGGSEVVLWALVRDDPAIFWRAVAVATTGNTLGAMSSYLIGRVFPRAAPVRGLDAVRRYGVVALLFSWLPVVGDALCVAAGWLRLNAWGAAAAVGVGKLGRYLVVAALA
jgi:membrane protein YqaA with SNARE-associated domain